MRPLAVSAEGNQAKCWAIPAMVFAILSCIGFIGNAWIQGIGGILALIASSMIICCDAAKAAGKLQACFVLFILGGIIEIVGGIVAVILFFSWKAGIEEGCQIYGTSGVHYDNCVNTMVGIVGAIIWPSVGLAVVSGVLILIAGVKANAAKGALLKGGGGGMA